MSYADDLLAWRQQRKAEAVRARVEEIKREHAEAVKDRDESIAAGDSLGAEQADDMAMALEDEYRHYIPQQPQYDPRLVRFMQENKTFLERHGANGYQAMAAAHEYMMRPQRSDTNDPRLTGMSWNPKAVYTPQYFE